MTDNKVYRKIRVGRLHDGQFLHMTLAAPPANILDGETMAEIVGCLEAEASDPHLKAVVFEGEGKHFCFGASVEEHTKAKAGAMIAGFHGLFKRLLATDLVTIALVRGQCLGGGMELALFCNFIIAEPKARFGQPEIQLAVFPPVAAQLLPGIIGQLRADDMILTGRSIDAQTAKEWGLVHAVAEDGRAALDDLLLTHLAPKSASSLRMANRAARSSWHRDLGARLDEMERLYVDGLMSTHDANEGIGAFLEKRKPEWKDE